MVTFANLGSVCLPSLKFVGLRIRKCVSCLSTTVSQLFEPQLQKNRHFYVPGLRFLFALGTPLRQSRKTLHYFSFVAWWFCFVHIRKFIGGKSYKKTKIEIK